MAVKWIGDVARELGIDVLDAVEFLAGKQNYPMNGLLDEEKVQFLKLGRGATRMESTNPIPMGTQAPPAAEEKPSKRGGKGQEKSGAAEKEATGPTSPHVTGRDRAEERT